MSDNDKPSKIVSLVDKRVQEATDALLPIAELIETEGETVKNYIFVVEYDDERVDVFYKTNNHIVSLGLIEMAKTLFIKKVQDLVSMSDLEDMME